MQRETNNMVGQLLRSDVFTMVKIYTMVFSIMTLCSLVCGYQHFTGTYCYHLQGRSDYLADYMLS
jgi:hypothetical protein